MGEHKTSRKAYRTTASSVLKKLLVVLAGLLAFLGLQALEGAKTNYERERVEPIVIVEDTTSPSDANAEYAITLARPALQKEFDHMIRPSDEALERLKARGDSVDKALVRSVEVFRGIVKSSIYEARNESRRTPFDSEDKLVAYLSERINKAREDAEKELSTEKKERTAFIENLRMRFSTNPAEFAAALKSSGNSDSEFNERFDKAANAQGPQTGDADNQEAPSTGYRLNKTDFLAQCAKEVDVQRDHENQLEISEIAYRSMDILRSQFVPVFLSQYVRDRKKNSPHPSSVSESVLDEHRGGHVIYQVFYLTFIAVLVFGILFPIYLLLRALPPFASSIDPLTERAKDLLSRQGVAATLPAPEILRTIALSAAAIGIGAVVVIANNPVSQRKVSDESVAMIPDNPYTRPPGIPSTRPSPASSPSPEVTPTPTPSPSDGTPPFPMPTPIQLHQTFKLDDSRIARLVDGLSGLQENFNTFQRRVDTDLPLKATTTDLTNLEKKLGPQLDNVTKRTEGLEPGDPKLLKTDIETLKGEVSKVRTEEIPRVRTDLSNRLDATNTAITDFREGSQGRSILRRSSELLGRERYKATPRSYAVLYNLMCNGVPCAPGSPEEAILLNLHTLSEEDVMMKKKVFLTRLGISTSAPSRWEALILRYNRLPY
jgi:vacuolar-type H+-ATPase subunit H